MSNLMAARLQMAISLGFHILFAVVGIALPLMMAIAEALWLRTKDPIYKDLAKRWAKGSAILFAVGAVSGTVLSFELGLLWPNFMKFAGPIIGLGFGLEGFAFFTEAIFLGIYLYGWDRISPLAHWLSGVVVAISGALSGVLVVSVNAWMNTPAGFGWSSYPGLAIVSHDIDPIAALTSPAMVAETLHMTLASYAATGLLVAGIHAALLRRSPGNPFHRRALGIALAVGGVAALLQPITGDYAARVVGRTQPVKLAAMEGQFRTQRYAPLRIGGLPDPEAGVTRYAIEIPGGLSFLAYHSFDAEVQGLDAVPRADRPPVRVVHLAFQAMVGCGMAMMGLALAAGYLAWRGRGVPEGRRFLLATMLVAPLGMIAVEAGWTVTEVGRQPWIIHGVMRTRDAVTPVPGLWASLLTYSLLYVFLGLVVISLLRAQFRESPGGAAKP